MKIPRSGVTLRDEAVRPGPVSARASRSLTCGRQNRYMGYVGCIPLAVCAWFTCAPDVHPPGRLSVTSAWRHLFVGFQLFHPLLARSSRTVVTVTPLRTAGQPPIPAQSTLATRRSSIVGTAKHASPRTTSVELNNPPPMSRNSRTEAGTMFHLGNLLA